MILTSFPSPLGASISIQQFRDERAIAFVFPSPLGASISIREPVENYYLVTVWFPSPLGTSISIPLEQEPCEDCIRFPSPLGASISIQAIDAIGEERLKKVSVSSRSIYIYSDNLTIDQVENLVVSVSSRSIYTYSVREKPKSII